MLMGKKLRPISPGHLANFPWSYVTLIFTLNFFYLLTNWTKYEKYKNLKGKGKLTVKCTIRLDLTVENLLHIKKFPENYWKSAILSKYTTIM